VWSTSIALTTALALVLSIAANAAPEPQDPRKQTPWHLYLDAKEAYDMKMAQGNRVLFVDVRDRIEIMFTGFTDVVDDNVPFLIANPGQWHASKPNFAMEDNPDFEPAIERALSAQGLTKEAPVILMCRSGGTRGAPSANLLWGNGYKQVYVVVDGFEGGTIKEGTKKNWRLKDGWKKAGLPWSYTLNKEKMYFVK
jgi:rhodanese-related sulfurtransferase